VRWKRAKTLEDQVKAAQDFVGVFKDETTKTPKHDEVESWLLYNRSVPVVDSVGAPLAPKPTDSLSLYPAANPDSLSSIERAQTYGPAAIPPEPAYIMPKDRNKPGARVGYPNGGRQ
jgi:hypothetical protein